MDDDTWIRLSNPAYGFFMGNDNLFHIANIGNDSMPPCREIILHDVKGIIRFEQLCGACFLYYIGIIQIVVHN